MLYLLKTADNEHDVGPSKRTLSERFLEFLSTSPVRYVRDLRLYLGSIRLRTTETAIAEIAHNARYVNETEFNRVFSRCFGMPPATQCQRAMR